MNEKGGEAQVVLRLSIPLSSVLTVEVITMNATALGEHYSICMNYCNSVYII